MRILPEMNVETHGRVHLREQPGPRVEILGPKIERADEVLTPLALQLLGSLHRRFNGRRLELLEARAARQAARRSSTAGPCRSSSRAPRRCAPGSGALRQYRQTSSTGASRSPVPSTAR